MKTVDGAYLCSFWDDLDEATDSFKGFNLKVCVEGEEMFQLDRAELLSSTLVYLNTRFNQLLKNSFFNVDGGIGRTPTLACCRPPHARRSHGLGK